MTPETISLQLLGKAIFIYLMNNATIAQLPGNQYYLCSVLPASKETVCRELEVVPMKRAEFTVPNHSKIRGE